VDQSNPPALKPLLPPDGVVFFTPPENPVIAVSRDLCKIAAFLQNREPYGNLRRFDDWWEHDALYFDKGEVDIHGLFNLIETPRSLLGSMPGDHRVFVGVAGGNHSCYVRFFVDWDERNENILGEYSITLSPLLAALFQREVVPSLTCAVDYEDAARYFGRIKA
jgi:hypothetical protein